MYKYIVLCLCVSSSGVLCDLNKEEGAACQWDGVKGKCVKETQCMTTLDTRGDKHLVCSTKDDVTIVCCTDCELVNDTRNVVMSPTAGYYWKDGTKARDSCLEYLDELPYSCREGFYSGIGKKYDRKRKCHTITVWGIGGSSSPGPEPRVRYSHRAMLGFGDELASAKWLAGGSIISNKYILTAAHVKSRTTIQSGNLKFVALGGDKRSGLPSAWQTHMVKRFIAHPDYKAPSIYNDIALIETETPITFNKNVLPVCLHVEEAEAETATTATWNGLESDLHILADKIKTIDLDKFTEEECTTVYRSVRYFKNGINYNTQMCYGSKFLSPETCRSIAGDPLLIDTQFSSCLYTIIGVTSFGKSFCGPNGNTPDVFTRVAHYIPWIESVVWA